jgi:GNAT superfamily N-acetyltransferase
MQTRAKKLIEQLDIASQDWEDTVLTLADSIRAEFHLKKFELMALDNRALILANIEVFDHERGRGVGSMAMRKLCAWADQHKQTILLEPEFSERERLHRFYSRFGFIDYTFKSEDPIEWPTTPEYMVRYPR